MTVDEFIRELEKCDDKSCKIVFLANDGNKVVSCIPDKVAVLGKGKNIPVVIVLGDVEEDDEPSSCEANER